MIRLWLDRPLQSRVDTSDVFQEAYLDLADRLPDNARYLSLCPGGTGRGRSTASA